MGTYGEKERATANHRSSKRRRNPQNRAWHTKKQNITWDQIKRHKYKVTDTMSDHYYRRRMLNRTERFMTKKKKKKTWCNSLYIFTLPHKSFSTLQKYYSLSFRRTHLLQSSHSKCLMAQKYSTYYCTQNGVCLKKNHFMICHMYI